MINLPPLPCGDDEVVCTIVWSRGDLREALNLRGFAATEEQIDLLAVESRKSLQERLSERSWEVLDTVIRMTFGEPVEQDSDEDITNA